MAWRGVSSTGVARKAESMSHAVFSSVVSAPMQRMFAPLWRRAVSASLTVWHSAARTFWKRFAAMDMPRPVRQTSTPKSTSPFATASATSSA